MVTVPVGEVGGIRFCLKRPIDPGLEQGFLRHVLVTTTGFPVPVHPEPHLKAMVDRDGIIQSISFEPPTARAQHS